MEAKLRTIVLLLAVVGVGFAANILPNPSFEVWLDSLGVPMPFGWLTSEYLYSGSARRDTLANSGNYCLLLNGGDTSAFATSVTLVRPGSHYEFVGHARVPGLLGGSFVLQFLSLLGRPVGTAELLPVFNSAFYRRYSRWVTAPDSAVLLSVSLATLPGAQVWVDDVTVDDTTIAGVADDRRLRYGPGLLHKVVVTGVGFEAAGGETGLLFDALGRRSRGRRPGVYFRR
uniref:CBM-cenC domain-containing protein n=1 Tax=candidate division WOR-3 bacterium TaxID=2052148 RepID=A0A7C4GAX9_UNCW3